MSILKLAMLTVFCSLTLGSMTTIKTKCTHITVGEMKNRKTPKTPCNCLLKQADCKGREETTYVDSADKPIFTAKCDKCGHIMTEHTKV